MVDISVSVDGLAEIERKLKLLPERLGNNAMRRALRRGANVIRDQARRNARGVDDFRTRNAIWKNIVVQGGGRRRERQEGGPMMRVGVRGGARNMQAHGEFRGQGKGNPGGDTWYWRLVEFGTSRTAAQPFMRPAAATAAQSAYDATAKAALVEIDKELTKLGAR